MTADLTRPDRGEAAARLADTLAELEPDLALVYCRLALGVLARNAPDVLTFLLDRTDATLDTVAGRAVVADTNAGTHT